MKSQLTIFNLIQTTYLEKGRDVYRKPNSMVRFTRLFYLYYISIMNVDKGLSSIKSEKKMYLRDIKDKTNKNKWINVLNNNPNKAIEEYHKILCKNNPENKGFCNLLDLFKILGALEQLNKQPEITRKMTETHEKEKDEIKEKLESKHEKEKADIEKQLSKQITQLEEEKGEILEKNEKLQAETESKTAELTSENEALKQQQQTANEDLIKINKAVEDLLEYINKMSETMGKDKASIIKEAQENIQRGMPQSSGKTKEEILENLKKIQEQ